MNLLLTVYLFLHHLFCLATNLVDTTTVALCWIYSIIGGWGDTLHNQNKTLTC